MVTIDAFRPAVLLTAIMPENMAAKPAYRVKIITRMLA